ncbi:phosphotransferase family protein [Modestobacter versicolor]|uniref:phosphotransferase family protein n=1 Tax=Modestobacter versicolor TaxID=429133 RepID=UPI0034E027D2
MSVDSTEADLEALVRPEALGALLADRLSDDSWRDLTARLITGGKSNLTFEVTSGGGSLVLRRPPTGTLLRGAHDMAREVTVQRALLGSAVPVADVVVFDPDGELLGVPFYVMRRLPGRTVSHELPPEWVGRTADVASLVDDLVATLAALHEVSPAAVGLGEFGRGEGFAARQVKTWRRQYEASRTHDVPAVEELHQRLQTHTWQQQSISIVHGDYRLDNCLVSDGLPPHITGVLDWELATLGDPLCDLGMLLFYWPEPGEPAPVLTPAVTASGVFPTRATVTASYAAASSWDLSDLPAYLALAHHKFVGIAQGIASRVASGQMAGQDFGPLDDEIERIATAGLAALEGI